MQSKKLFIHGGSSLITKYLIQNFVKDFSEFHIFCRNKDKSLKILDIQNYAGKKFIFYENDLNDINKTLNDINKLPTDLSGVLWVTGYTGDPEEEYLDIDKLKLNINVNFTNVIISLTKITNKIILNNSSFVCVITSVAGLRGRKKRLFYSSAKGGLINFLSGLRQKFNNRLNVITVVPGYILTNSFQEKANKFLMTSAEKSGKIIYSGVKKNKEIIFINSLWRIIMFFILSIPEKIFKKLNF